MQNFYGQTKILDQSSSQDKTYIFEGDLPLSPDKMWKERGRCNLQNVIVFPPQTTGNVRNFSHKYDHITLSESLEAGKIFLSNLL